MASIAMPPFVVPQSQNVLHLASTMKKQNVYHCVICVYHCVICQEANENVTYHTENGQMC
jgi:hypothetical protein